jgi:hypothetical protein
VLVAACAAVVSAYGVWVAREAAGLARIVDRRFQALELDERRFEILRTALVLEAQQIRLRTAVEDVQFRAKKVVIRLSLAAQREPITDMIATLEKEIVELNADINRTRDIVAEARGFTGRTLPTPEAIQAAYETLEYIKTSIPDFDVTKAEYEGTLAAAAQAIELAQL